MSINNINQYNDYEKQIAATDTTGVLPNAKTAKSGATDTILPAANGDTNTTETPKLSSPSIPICDIDLSAWDDCMPASLGATLLAAVQEFMNQQRQDASTVRFANSMAVADNLQTESKNTLKNATVSLALSLCSSLCQIGASTVSIVGGARNFSKGMQKIEVKGEMVPKYSTAQLDALNQKWQGISGAINGVASIFTSFKDFESAKTDAANKQLEAANERLRAAASQLDSFIETMKETIKSARQNQESIQQSMNQMRTKIVC